MSADDFSPDEEPLRDGEFTNWSHTKGRSVAQVGVLTFYADEGFDGWEAWVGSSRTRLYIGWGGTRTDAKAKCERWAKQLVVDIGAAQKVAT